MKKYLIQCREIILYIAMDFDPKIGDKFTAGAFELVEHPKTPTDPKDFDQVPTNRHLFGGTMWWNKIDVGVTVHRPNREDKHDRTVLIKTWKVKKQQLNGRPGEGLLYFDVKTNRYYPDNHCSIHPMIMPDLYTERDSQPF